ncbi:hypothetical protein ASE21_19400 [Flavobacterium sp. Root901]|uniref:phospholipase D-like domain-containing protein n=1 Tax=Flavobacterium sp. Root901 TaxID=1736605 RepID=UPI00070E300C|nr:phospholipase D-like domain-containing protein [Flavobacterium sp. Root901]KRD06338.1 hypothetical protein ASE21_19400 [Flavobacterium sp. Root901]
MNEVILKNPITDRIRNSINISKHKLNFAVPFLSSFATSVLNEHNTKSIVDKRLLTRFDDSCLVSFDTPTLKTLLELGFVILYDNTIHLKLYITDKETFVTSSNFTKGGFESNIELTIKVDSENLNECNEIFNEMWQNAKENKITYELLEANWSKYKILQKRNDSVNNKKRSDLIVNTGIGKIDIQKVISEIFNLKDDYSRISSLTFEANQVKEKFKNKLKGGYNKDIFYANEFHSNRRGSLFYDFTYGHESHIASTGLRELQFKTAFENTEFQNVVEYIYPEMVGMKPWNFEYKDELFEFCCGIFDFKIPQYTEALPIRLASYFYSEYFLPIFKLDHLRKISNALDIETNAKSKGERLYAYTSHITNRMKHLPYDNNIKSNIAYKVLYTVELHNRLDKGESYENILSDYKQIWKKKYISNGWKVLNKLNP